MLRILLASLAVCVSLALTDRCRAQTSTQTFIADPKSAYAAIKSAVRRVDPALQKPPSLFDGKYAIAGCEGPHDYMMAAKDKYEDDQLFRTIGSIAHRVVVWTHVFSALKYPVAVWEPVVTRHEAREFTAAVQAHRRGGNALAKFEEGAGKRVRAVEDELVARLGEYRQMHRSLAEVVWEAGGCGAGEISVTIETDPKGGQILFIPTFFYELCRAQGLDPEDTTRCNRWRETDDGQLAMVTGNYQYIARWDDKAVQKGKLTVDWGDGGKTKIVRRR